MFCSSFKRINKRNILKRYQTKEVYERKTPIEHVLLRPGMYVGQINPSILNTWIFNNNTKRMEKLNIYVSPALVKIYDEILVNAADNRWRSPEMTFIDINVQQNNENLTVSIKNNGLTIPIEFNQKEKLYIPELIFGHLMTGSNFDDTKGRVTGGMHGYGAKLTNIFSHSFEVEIYDSIKKTKYRQVWNDHMKNVLPPEITQVSSSNTKKQTHSDSYTKVTFTPDLKLFGTSLSTNNLNNNNLNNNDQITASINDLMLLFYRRALDISGIGLSRTEKGKTIQQKPIEVIFNGELIPINSFSQYMKLFTEHSNSLQTPENKEMKNIFDKSITKINDRWEVGIIPSPTGSHEHISFVNSVWTSRGGTHVNHITNQCVKYIQELISSKLDETTISSSKIKNHLMIFINCLIENPSFDSQGKESLTTKLSQFSAESELPSSYLKKIFHQNTDLIKIILDDINSKKDTFISKTKKSKITGTSFVEGLEDAHNAGSGGSRNECTLIITEGESAKALAIAGLEVVGREKYGVLSIQGKMINAVNSRRNVFENKEVLRFCQALGLSTNKKYANGDISSLRYGHILIMTDQDPDGSHIKGLTINLLHKYWPNLLQVENFIQQFTTPLIKVTGFLTNLNEEDKKKQKSTLQFYSQQEYEVWKNEYLKVNGEQSLKNITIKYYKGLGTSTAAEGREYFRNLDLHIKNFVYGEETKKSIELAFSPDFTEERKKWLKEYEKSINDEIHIPPTQKNILYEDFINKELIHYSHLDLLRSIPSMLDGLKISQRKILYTCFHEKIRKEIKVVQLSGLATELTAYHHGELSIHGLTVRMAQDFIGSNNIALLEPCGQFGTRHSGGKDSASPRYIFTRLSPITDFIFPEADMNILNYEFEDGKQVEPTYYLPIIPMILVNGTLGVGTGWSTRVPHYNPIDIIHHLEHKIRNTSPTKKLIPWLKGFKGKVIETEIGYESVGIAIRTSKKTIEISELPFYRWTEDYKIKLFKILEKKQIELTDFKENHTVDHVKFELSANKKSIDILERGKCGLISKLNLTSQISTDNMHAFDEKMKLRHYLSPEQIIDAFYIVRLNGYNRRKASQLAQLAGEELKLRNQARFISDIFAKKIELMDSGRPFPTDVMNQMLRLNGYSTEQEIRNISTVKSIRQKNDQNNDNRNEYSYLLDLPIRSLTSEKAELLQLRANKAQQSLRELSELTPENIWLDELKTLETTLIQLDKAYLN